MESPSAATSGGALSKGLLQMKFMQKTASKLQQEVEEEEIGALEEQWVIESLPQKYISLLSNGDAPIDKAADDDLFEYNNSITILEQLAFGRMSFQGMNPEVELLMRNDGKSEEETSQQAPETSITDEDMAEQYKNKNMDKKFKTKRQRRDSDSEEEEEVGDSGTKKQKTPNKIVGDVKTFLKPKEYQWLSISEVLHPSPQHPIPNTHCLKFFPYFFSGFWTTVMKFISLIRFNAHVIFCFGSLGRLYWVYCCSLIPN